MRDLTPTFPTIMRPVSAADDIPVPARFRFDGRFPGTIADDPDFADAAPYGAMKCLIAAGGHVQPHPEEPAPDAAFVNHHLTRVNVWPPGASSGSTGLLLPARPGGVAYCLSDFGNIVQPTAVRWGKVQSAPGASTTVSVKECQRDGTLLDEEEDAIDVYQYPVTETNFQDRWPPMAQDDIVPWTYDLDDTPTLLMPTSPAVFWGEVTATPTGKTISVMLCDRDGENVRGDAITLYISYDGALNLPSLVPLVEQYDIVPWTYDITGTPICLYTFGAAVGGGCFFGKVQAAPTGTDVTITVKPCTYSEGEWTVSDSPEPENVTVHVLPIWPDGIYLDKCGPKFKTTGPTSVVIYTVIGELAWLVYPQVWNMYRMAGSPPAAQLGTLYWDDDVTDLRWRYAIGEVDDEEE